MTIAVNNFVRLVGSLRKISHPIKSDGTHDINGGDLLWYDSGDACVKPLDSDAHAAYFAGVAEDSSFLNPYGTKQYKASLGGIFGGIVELYTTAGDTYNHGDAVYTGADAQTITNTAGAMVNKLGYVVLRDGQSAITGAAGVKVDVFIVAKFPTTLG